MSVTNTKLIAPGVMKFTGSTNYARLVEDKNFWSSVLFTLEYTLVSTLLAYILGLIAALMMHRPICCKGLVRMLLLIPWVVPAVVGTYSWSWLLNDQTGVINIALMKLGLIDTPILWLVDRGLVRLVVILFCVWKTFPFMSITLLASLQSIEGDLMEAAAIDGANVWQRFRYITMPLIRRESLLALILMVMWNFNRMDFIYLMTEGGPVNATRVVSIYAYHMAFSRGNLGYSSTISVAMMLIMSVFLVVYFRIRKGAEQQ